MFTYSMPVLGGLDVDKYLAGKRENWAVEELEVFQIIDPIDKLRYEENRQSLVNLAMEKCKRERDEQLMEEIL